MGGGKRSAQDFLQERISSEVKIHGTRIEFPSEKTEDIKLLLHKFLHEKNLTDFRVLSREGVLEIAPVSVRKGSQAMKGSREFHRFHHYPMRDFR